MIFAILFVLGAAALAFWRDSFETEIFKVTYEFCLVAGIGGWLSYEYKRREQAAAAREAGRVLQREMLTEVINAYGRAKKVRRLLRTKAIGELGTPEAFVRGEPYEEQMECLIDVQLEFEALRNRAKSNSDLFPTKLEEKLESMETYLNKIIKKYEVSPFRSKVATLPLDKFGKLEDPGSLEEFTNSLAGKTEDDKKNAPFRRYFSTPFHETVETLQKVIIEPDLTNPQSRRRL